MASPHTADIALPLPSRPEGTLPEEGDEKFFKIFMD
jgi:hypothetical protein